MDSILQGLNNPSGKDGKKILSPCLSASVVQRSCLLVGMCVNTKTPELLLRRFCFVLGGLACCFQCSLSFCPTLFHHHRNAFLGSGAQPTTTTSSGAKLLSSASNAFQRRDGLIETISFFS